jgi:hypothetical protein
MLPSAEESAREFFGCNHPGQMEGYCCTRAKALIALLSSREAAVRAETVEECISVVQHHLDKAATIRQAVAQPGMVPELSPERKQEEHRIAAATIALRGPLAKAIRSGAGGG